MNRPHRSIEIFTMSALDLFVTAMGSFAILMMILFPYFKNERKQRAAEAQGCVLMCAWATRVQDYEQFKKDTEKPGEEVVKPENRRLIFDEDSWKNPGYEQGPDFPVVTVTWDEAVAFCQWLTKKERATKMIGPEAEYRLPTVAEWAAAAGPEKYPWGKAWPPPAKVGNFGGEEYSRGRGYSGAGDEMKGYEDAHELAAPVGSYAPSRDGLFDVAGNVQTWTQDWYLREMAAKDSADPDDGGGQKFRARVGSTWDTTQKVLMEAGRIRKTSPTLRSQTLGFRCVLVLKPPPKP